MVANAITYSGLTTNLANSPVTRTQSFPSATSLTFTPDLKVNTTGAIGGDSMVMASATVSFTQVPEPATILLFSAGLAGLAATRRRRSA